MKTRRLVKDNQTNNIVWFGSYGKNDDGTAKFANVDNKHDNYCVENDAIAGALTQKLSVLKNELWFNVNYGLPLLDKSTKAIMDATAANIIMKTSGVKELLSFTSKVVNNTYYCNFKVKTIYGIIEIA